MSFPKHAKSQQCCDLYKTQKKGSHVVPSISPNSLTALFSPKLSHFMLHAPKLKKKSSLVPRLFHVPIKAACSQLVPRQRFASRAPAVSSHAASASTTTTSSISNQCQHQCTASIKPVPVLLVLVHQTSASSTDSKSTSTVCATTASTSNLVYKFKEGFL